MVKKSRGGGRSSGWWGAKLFLLVALLITSFQFAYVFTGYFEYRVSPPFCLFTRTLVCAAAAAAGSKSDGTTGRERSTEDNGNKVVEHYSSVFGDLIMEGFLSPASKSLAAGSTSDSSRQVRALRGIGVTDAIGVAQKPSPPLVLAGDILQRLPFPNSSFDFVYAGADVLGRRTRSRVAWTAAAELARVAKPDWYLVIHTHSAGDPYSLDSLLALFPSCRLVKSGEVRSPPGSSSAAILHEVVLRRETPEEERARRRLSQEKAQLSKCRLKLERKLQLVKSLEPLIPHEPLRPWIDLKRNLRNIRYLPTIADIGFKRRYIYVDVGARGYGSSIGGWFRRQYPKQGREFEVYAIEADDAFHGQYTGREDVKLLPYAAWVRNETLQFEFPRGGTHEDPNHDGGEEGEAKVAGVASWGMGRVVVPGLSSPSAKVKQVHGLDLAEWLRSVATADDLVVVKMDVEGAEFELVPRMLESGVMCLVDEMFLECHYNRWQRCCPGVRAPKYKHTYAHCLQLFRSLRKAGVLVHQWW